MIRTLIKYNNIILHTIFSNPDDIYSTLPNGLKTVHKSKFSIDFFERQHLLQIALHGHPVTWFDQERLSI